MKWNMKEEECSKDFIAPEEGGLTLPPQGRNPHTNLLYWLKENFALWGEKNLKHLRTLNCTLNGTLNSVLFY